MAAERIGLEAIFDDSGFNTKFNRYIDKMDQGERATRSSADTAERAASRWDIAMGSVLADAAMKAADLVVDAIGRMLNSLERIGAYSLETAVSVESAFAGIIKTTEGLTDAEHNLTSTGEMVLQQFRDMAKTVPTDLEELMGLGELAGQLGITEEALAGFVETMAGLGESTNVTGEAAATAIAQIQNIFNVEPGNAVEEAERFGSALVALGNNFATTESNILNFTQRMAGAGQIAGLTQADILGIATAMASVGISAEAGATSVNKVFLAMVEEASKGGGAISDFVNSVNDDVDDFAQLFEEDASLAFEKFVESLALSGDDAGMILEELGLKDQRLLAAFLSLAGGGDLLSEAIDTANQAWDENTALMAEVEARLATTESKWGMFKNSLRDVALTAGDQLLPALNDLMDTAGPALEDLAEMLGPALEGAAPILEDIAGALGGLISEGVENLPAFLDQLGGIFDLLSGDTSLGNLMDLAQTLSGLGLPPELVGDLTRLGEAIGGLSGEGIAIAPVVGEFNTEVFDTMKSVFDDLSSEVIPFLTEQIDKISAWFDENGPLIEEYLGVMSKRFAAFGAAVGQAWDVIEPLLGGLVDLLLGEIKFAMQVVTGDWEGAWQTIQEMVSDAGEAIWEAIVELWDFVLQLFGTSGEEMGAVWNDVWEQLSLIVSTMIDLVKTTIDEKLAAIGEGWMAFWEGIQTWFGDTLQGLVDLVDEHFPQLDELILTFLELIQGVWQLAWDAISQVVSDTLVAILEFLTENFETISEFIEEKMVIIEGIWDTWTDLASQFEELFSGIVTTVKNQFDLVITNIQDAISRAIKAVAEKIPDFIQAGRDMIGGFIKGIEEKAEAFINALIAIAMTGLDRIMQTLGIESPSTEFRWIGEMVVEGLTRGVQSKATEPADAMLEVANRMMQPVMQPVSLPPSISTTNHYSDTRIDVQANYAELQQPGTILDDLMAATEY